jgi:hypothetical protein
MPVQSGYFSPTADEIGRVFVGANTIVGGSSGGSNSGTGKLIEGDTVCIRHGINIFWVEKQLLNAFFVVAATGAAGVGGSPCSGVPNSEM